MVVAVAMAGCGPEREGETLEFVVPAGTGDRLAMGETVTIMPSELTFRVGDTIRIRNEDRFPQSVGPYLVAAGEVFELKYGSPGTYEGYCPLSEGETYRIVVTQ
jgi:plastocyanin